MWMLKFCYCTKYRQQILVVFCHCYEGNYCSFSRNLERERALTYPFFLFRSVIYRAVKNVAKKRVTDDAVVVSEIGEGRRKWWIFACKTTHHCFLDWNTENTFMYQVYCSFETQTTKARFPSMEYLYRIEDVRRKGKWRRRKYVFRPVQPLFRFPQNNFHFSSSREGYSACQVSLLCCACTCL